MKTQKCYRARRRFHGCVVWVVIAGFVALGTFASAEPVAGEVVVGAPIPELALVDHAGEPFVYDEATTRVCLAIFSKPGDRFTATMLFSVNRMFKVEPTLMDSVDRWLVISDVTADHRQQWAKAMSDPHWSLLFDTDGETAKGFGVRKTPTTVVIDSEQKIAAVYPGYQSKQVRELSLKLGEVLGQDFSALGAQMSDAPSAAASQPTSAPAQTNEGNK